MAFAVIIIQTSSKKPPVRLKTILFNRKRSDLQVSGTIAGCYKTNVLNEPAIN